MDYLVEYPNLEDSEAIKGWGFWDGTIVDLEPGASIELRDQVALELYKTFPFLKITPLDELNKESVASLAKLAESLGLPTTRNEIVEKAQAEGVYDPRYKTETLAKKLAEFLDKKKEKDNKSNGQ